MPHDHHFHPLGYAGVVNGLDLMATADLPDLQARLAARAATISGAVIGQRLNDEGMSEQRLPTRFDLDEAIADRPVLLYRYCGHIAVANSKALELAGVVAGIADPPGGRVDRSPDGEPTGVLRETALSLVGRALNPLTKPPSDTEILDAMALLPGYGLGSVTGMVSTADPIWCGVGDELDALCRLAEVLPIDIDLFVITDSEADLASAAERIGRAGGGIRFSGWKGFADGSFGGHTAAMYEPYADRPDEVGTIRLDPARTLGLADVAFDLGGAVAIHAIGDRANDLVLDVFDKLVSDGRDPGRMRVEHASILTPRAVERMARLGVTASVQPAFLASEDWLPKRLGEERMDLVYPFRSLLEAGVTVLGGSDTPVESPDPEIGIRAAVDRHGLNPPEALTEDQARALFAPPVDPSSKLGD